MLKRTVLYPEHKAANAKMVGFSGWEMPVSYRGILEEHQAVRQYAGVFDVSHMGVIDFAGEQVLEMLQHLTVNDVESLAINQSQYTMMLDESGQVLDDMILTRLQNMYRLVVNCGNTQKILSWLHTHQPKFSVHFTLREEINILALQGPSSKRILESLMDTTLAVRPFGISFGQLLGEPVMV
ncbi:MAG: glycine cleavage system aminomethyltransferase GcvT, partial [Candidatus Margulisiibacteriota bacterium]